MQKKLLLLLFFISKLGAMEEEKPDLSLEQAVHLTLSRSPKLNISEDEIGEKEGVITQSRLYPIPSHPIVLKMFSE